MEERTRLSRLFESYLRAERGFSPHTVRNYLADVETLADFLAAKRTSLEAASDVEIREFIRSQAVAHAPATVSRRRAALKTFYRLLLREKLVSRNPAAALPSLRMPKRLPQILSQREAGTLVEGGGREREGDFVRDAAVLELLYATGMRVSELAALDLCDIDLTRMEVRIRSGKGGKERHVFFGKAAAQALQAYLDRRGLWTDGRAGDALFFGKKGKRISDRGIRRLVDRNAHAIGKPVHPHVLRHSFATHMLENGAGIRTIQELLGHASLSTTQKYTHLDLATIRAAYEKAHPRGKE